MIANLVIGKPVVQEKTPKDIFRMHVKVMHGDADMYTTKIWDVERKDLVELYGTLYMFLRYFALCHNSACDEHRVEEAIGKDWHDTFSNLVGGDVTCESRWAMAEEVKITYFSPEGIESDVIIELKEEGDTSYKQYTTLYRECVK